MIKLTLYSLLSTFLRIDEFYDAVISMISFSICDSFQRQNELDEKKDDLEKKIEVELDEVKAGDPHFSQ